MATHTTFANRLSPFRPAVLARRAGRGRLLTLLGVGLSLAAQAQVTVVSRQPTRHARAVPATAAVAVGFSQPITAASAANLRVYGGLRQGKRAGSVSGGGTATLTFTPSLGYAPGEVLTVSVPATLASPSGGTVARQVYQFTAATGGTGKGFFLDTARVGNTATRDQVLGDIDNDGDLDLLTTGALFGCRVFLNDGTGKYTFKTGFPTGEVQAGLALLDVNQDGYLDVLSGDSKNNLLAVRLNDGTGDFLLPSIGYQNAPVGAGVASIAAGDVDGDGDQDFVTANTLGGSSTVWFNSGSYLPSGYYFTTNATVNMGSAPTAVALADIDNDGDLDLLTANASSSTAGEVHVSRNAGAGSFGAYSTVAVGLQPSELTLADLDGDGDLDLLTANAGAASVSVRLNNGSGTFSGTTTLALPAGSTPSGLRTGDLDADGDLDLVVAQGRGGRIITFLNTAGTLAAQGRALRLSRDASLASVGVTLGDVDGDGDLDLVTSDDDGNVVLSRNAGPPPPLPAPIITSLAPDSGPVGTPVVLTGTNLTDVTGVFFNGLAAPGFALAGAGTSLRVVVPAGASSGPVTVATEEAGTATSPGSFTVPVPVPVLLTGIVPGRNASNVALATDVVATFQSPITAATADNVRVFGSQRRGRRPGSLAGGGTATLTFDPAQDFAPGEQVSVSLPASLRAADGNGARPQVVQFTAAVGGTGQANFTAATTLAMPRAGEPVVGDLDNDGDLDLLVPNYGASTVSVRLNNGAGTFSNGPDLAAGANVSSVVTSDVDADGDLDLVLVYVFGTVRTWLNQGNATFVSSSALATTTGVSQLVLGDLDADGDQDLLLLFPRSAQVQLNDGAGNFAAGPVFYLSEGINGVSLGDIDNDGDLDLLVGGEGLDVYRNDGTGQFGPAQPVALVASPGGLALGDLDGDGDLDLVARTTLNGATRLTVYSNNGTGTFGNATNLPLDGLRVLLVDVDADGDLDLVARNNIGLNDGTGAFRSVFPTGSNVVYNSTLAAGDLDGDGDLDLVTGEDNDVVSIRLNQPRPAPTLTALAPGNGPVGTRVLLTGTGFIGVRAVTFNGQPAGSHTVRSATELVATVPAGATTGPVAVTTPAGTGTSATSFVVAEAIAVTSLSPARHAASAPRGAAVTIGFAQPISAASAVGLRVLGAQRRGQRPGTLTGGGTAALTFTPAQAFAPGEAVSVTIPGSLAGTAGGRVRPQVYQFTAAADGLGTGLFMPLGTADVPIYYRAIDLAVGDLDNDGDQDFVTTDGSIRLNDGHGAFASPTGVELSSDPWGIAVGDLNNDGLLDVVTTNGDVRLNLGAADFEKLPSLTNIPANIRDLALGDLDGDGDLDLVMPTYATDSVCVRFNDGTGRFPTKRLLAVGNRPVGVAIGDVDNDGQLDIVVASEGYGSNASTLHICFNSGNGLFDRKNVLAGGSYIQRVVLGDLDADGDLDLVTNTGYVRLNDGAGNFTGTQTTAANQGLALGDVDGDGDLDLLATGNFNSALRLNDGRGNFSTGPAPDLGENWGNVVLADLDDDGDLDAATTDNSARLIRLRLNHRLAPPAALSFTPARGLPGEIVIVTGTDLVGTTTVSFNGTAAPGFVLNSAFQLTVRVPAGATSGPISVTNPKGTATSAQSFTVLTPVPVLSLSPARNAVAPLTAPVVVRFGQALAAHTAGNLAVFSAQSGGQLAGTRQGAGSSTLTLVPARPYQPGERVRVSLPAYTEANSLRVVRQVYQFTAATGGTGRGFFEEPVSFPRLSTSGGSMVLGDVDGDGDQDLLTGTFNTVQVQLNNGAGAYSAAGTVSVADNPTSLTLGDVDGDGDLDLACTSFGSQVVSVRLNDGAGRFSGTTNVTVGDSPNDVALADMDADGDLDLVTINSGSYSSAIIPVVSFSVRFNDGGGNFSGTEDVPLDAITHHGVSNITLGDLDGDGDLDVAAGAAGYLFIYLNDGLGHLASAYARLSPPEGTENISMNDVDADGDLDLLVLGSSSTGGVLSTMSVLRNDGRATFTATNFLTVANTNSMVVGDLDADGDVDILITKPGANGQLWLNDGRGTFARLLDLHLRSTDGQPMLCDVDGDGDLDLLTSVGGGAFNVRLNGPTPPPVVAGFTPAVGPAGTTVTITGSGFLGTTAVRFNGTLAPGFVINSPSQLTVRVPEGATTGFIAVTSPVATATSSLAFTVLPKVNVIGQAPAANAVAVAPGATIGLTFASAVTAATAGNLRVFGNQRRGRRPGSLAGGDTPTLTFDPDQDFAPGEQVSVSLPATLRTANGGLVRRQVYQFTAATGGTGRGLFRAGPNFSPGWYASDLAVGDIDNDGDLDLLTPVEVQYTGANAVAVRLNDGQGRFTAGASINTGTSTSPTRLVLGDVDADGDLDLVASYGGFAVSVCLNQGRGTFAPAMSVSNVPCSTLALGDVDADGDLDLVMASFQYHSLQVALNDGNGRFGTPSVALDSPSAMTVTLGDVDGDGDLDALSANPTGPRLYLNDGEGTFAAGVVLPVAGEVRDVALGDLDADGDLDVAVSSHDASWLASLTLLRNQGNGSFATGSRVALGTYTNRLCLGDLDHDGDLDAVATNGSSDDVALRLNDGTGTFSVLANVPVSANPIALALADLDGDGDLDFAALQSATGGALVNIRLNDSQPLATAPAAAGGVPVLLYPNPAHGQFVVAVPAALRPAAAGRSLQLYNALGQLVLEQALRLSASGEQTVDMSSLPAGIYTLRLPLSSGLAAYKISVY